MKDYVPSDHLPIVESLDLIGRYLSGSQEVDDKSGAMDWLRNALATERISAIAIAENGRMIKVGAALWRSQKAEAIFMTGLLPSGNLRESFQAREAGTLYYRVLVPRTAVEKAKSTSLPSTIAAQTRCCNWLISLMYGDKEKTKPAYFAEAQLKFGIGRRAFDRAWSEALNKSGNIKWSQPGRKS